MGRSVYADATTRKTAATIAQVTNVVFDMSGKQPGSFGATVGQASGSVQTLLRNRPT